MNTPLPLIAWTWITHMYFTMYGRSKGFIRLTTEITFNLFYEEASSIYSNVMGCLMSTFRKREITNTSKNNLEIQRT